MKSKALGLYIHFPFCIKKCLYCDFSSYAGREDLMEDYLKAIKIEIAVMGAEIGSRAIKTVFLGGGTPTLYDGKNLTEILEFLGGRFSILPGAEITIEANPETLDTNKLRLLRNAGINRISMGMQAGQNRLLKSLGRTHTVEDVGRSLGLAKKIGFDNINLDLMFGIPSQTLGDWMESLELAVNMGAQHISAYALIIEEGTPFFKLKQKGELSLPFEETEREMYHRGADYLNSQGYNHYEISNFAKPGVECEHNLIYWHNEEYIGIGSGAHSFLDGERRSNYRDICKYIETIQSDRNGVEHKEIVSMPWQRFETIMMGLRLRKGVSKPEFRNRFGQDIGSFYRDALKELKNEEMLVETEGSIYLTSKGMDFQNRVLLHFMK